MTTEIRPSRSARSMSFKERLLSRVAFGSYNECWEWQGGRCSSGRYGGISDGGKPRAAHRAMYELFVGPIPEGLVVDHLCGNKLCVNPAHLEAVTDQENILRGNGVAAANARKTHCIKGHPFDGFDGRQRICRTCRREQWRRYDLKRRPRKAVAA